jgi:transposase-like protein
MSDSSNSQIACKYCGSEGIVKFGKYKESQRYWCKSCNRKFKADDNAFHMKVPANYVSRAVAEFYTGSAVNDIRETLYQETGYKPSKSIVWKWITKYTDLAVNNFRDFHPKVGDVWACDETMVDLDKQLKVWVYNVIDEKTRYLLASRIALSRTTHDAEAVMTEAKRRAGKSPKQVLTDDNRSYDDGIELAFGADTEHIHTRPFKSGDSTQRIERYHGTYKDRVKVMRAFKDIETLIQFTDGWLVYFNFFKHHQALAHGNTPAEEAGITYDVKNWADLVRMPVSKEAEIESHIEPKIVYPKIKIDMSRAFKRRRKPLKNLRNRRDDRPPSIISPRW